MSISKNDARSDQRQRTIWMGDIRPEWNTETIMTYLMQMGITSKPLIRIKCNARQGWKDENGNRIGFALLTFAAIEEAQEILSQLNGLTVPGSDFVFNLKPNAYSNSTRSNSSLVELVSSECVDGEVPSLEQQLDPLTISQLRERLVSYGHDTMDLEEQAQSTGGRIAKKNALVQMLCYLYRSNPTTYPRFCRYTAGVPVPATLVNPLLACLRQIKWLPKKRKVDASEYLVLGVPADGAKCKIQPQFAELWKLARCVLAYVDPSFEYSSIAVTKNFKSSPHVDMNDKSFQYALSMGDFFNGGQLCVEASAAEVVSVDTKNALAKVDGRYPHWVSPYEGERYSVIYYRVNGEALPRTTALL